MSVDEAAVLHELLNDVWLEGYLVSGIFYFMWIFPAALLVAIFLALYWRFFLALPAGIRMRVALAGLLYVGGALGTEVPLGFWAARHGDSNLVYGIVQTCQESFELAGASLFFATLLRHLAGGAERLAVSVGGDGPSSPTA